MASGESSLDKEIMDLWEKNRTFFEKQKDTIRKVFGRVSFWRKSKAHTHNF